MRCGVVRCGCAAAAGEGVDDLCRQIGHSLRAEDRDGVPECEDIGPESWSNHLRRNDHSSRDRLVTSSSMIISTQYLILFLMA